MSFSKNIIFGELYGSAMGKYEFVQVLDIIILFALLRLAVFRCIVNTNLSKGKC